MKATKIIGTTLTVLALLSLAGCGDNNSQNNASGKQSSSATSTKQAAALVVGTYQNSSKGSAVQLNSNGTGRYVTPTQSTATLMTSWHGRRPATTNTRWTSLIATSPARLRHGYLATNWPWPVIATGRPTRWPKPRVSWTLTSSWLRSTTAATKAVLARAIPLLTRVGWGQCFSSTPTRGCRGVKPLPAPKTVTAILLAKVMILLVVSPSRSRATQSGTVSAALPTKRRLALARCNHRPTPHKLMVWCKMFIRI
jgi:hypothetical protein